MAQVTTKGQLVIPSRLRRKYSIGEGTRVIFEEENGKITMQPVTEDYIKSVCGMLKAGNGASATNELLKEHREELKRQK